MSLLKRIALVVLAVLSTNAYASSIHIQCLDMRFETDGEDLIVSFDSDNDVFIIPSSGAGGDAEYARLLSRLQENRQTGSALAALLDPRKTETFREVLDTLDAQLSSSLTPQEKATLAAAKQSIKALTAEREAWISDYIKKAKARGVRTDEAKLEAAHQTRAVQLKLGIKKAKETALAQFMPKAKSLGIDLLEPLASVEKSIRAATVGLAPPSSKGKLPGIARGAGVYASWAQSNLEIHYDKHGPEFTPSIIKISVYERRAKELAASTDPRTFAIMGNPSRPDRRGRMYKFDPVTQELVVIGVDDTSIVSYFPLYEKNSPRPSAEDAYRTFLRKAGY